MDGRMCLVVASDNRSNVPGLLLRRYRVLLLLLFLAIRGSQVSDVRFSVVLPVSPSLSYIIE